MWTAYIKDISGATAIEYGLIAALIGVFLIGGLSTLTKSIDGLFTRTTNELS